MKRVLIITLILASMLTCLFGCSKNPLVTARREELQRMTQCMIDNSGLDGVVCFDTSSRPSELRLSFYGVNDLAAVDNMVTTLNTYLEENEDCTYGLDHTFITLWFYDTKPSDYEIEEQKWFASVRNFSFVRTSSESDVVLEDGLYYIDINIANNLCISEFSTLNNHFTDIEVPGTIVVDDADVLLEMDWLETFCIDFLQRDGIVYDDYVRICNMADYINDSYGDVLVYVFRDTLLVRNWLQEYGDDFVEPAYMNSEG